MNKPENDELLAQKADLADLQRVITAMDQKADQANFNQVLRAVEGKADRFELG